MQERLAAMEQEFALVAKVVTVKLDEHTALFREPGQERNYSGTHEPRRQQGSRDSILNAIALITTERLGSIRASTLALPTFVAGKQ